MRPQDIPGKQDARWWVNESGDEETDRKVRGQRLANVASTIYRVQEPLRQAWTVAWRLYTNQPIMGLGPKTYKMRVPGPRYNAQGLNLVKAVQDSWHAQITKDEPRTWFDVVGGDRRLKRRAKQMQSFMDGVATSSGWRQVRPLVMRDCGLFGEGISKTFRDDSVDGKPQIKVERRNPWFLLCDEQEAVNGTPANMYEIMWVDRNVLMEEYPELAGQIREATSTTYMEAAAETYSDTNFLDFVVVVEAWHLPRISGKDGTLDGRRTMIVGDLVLEDELYTWHRFPFDWCYRAKPVQGVYDQGIPGELAPQQLEINRIMRCISQSQRLACGHWLVPNQAEIDTSAINNVIASVIRHEAGFPPEFKVFQAVSEEVYQYLWAIWAKGFESQGVSQMAAMAQMPVGLKSSVAIDTYADVSSARFAPQYKEYQDWNKRVAEQIIHLAREITDEYPGFETKATGSRATVKTIRAAEVLLKDEEFNLEIKEVNQLGADVPAKMETVADLTSAGLVSQDDGKRMMIEDGGLPDLTEYESLEASSYNFVAYCADKAIDDDEYIQPNLFVDDPQLCIQRMRKLYLKAQMDDVPDESLRLLRQWMEEMANMASANAPPAPPQPGMAAGPSMPKPGGPLGPAQTMGAPPRAPLQAA